MMIMCVGCVGGEIFENNLKIIFVKKCQKGKMFISLCVHHRWVH